MILAKIYIHIFHIYIYMCGKIDGKSAFPTGELIAHEIAPIFSIAPGNPLVCA